jgi:hypothetical protein
MSRKSAAYLPQDHNCLSPYLMINGLDAFEWLLKDRVDIVKRSGIRNNRIEYNG